MGVIFLTLAGVGPRPAEAQSLPQGFAESDVIDGLNRPTVMQFLPDGGLLVGEKSGVIKHFDGLGDATPVTILDRRTEVYNYWDRGLVGLAVDPSFTTNHYVYILYTRDALPGQNAPKWGQPGVDIDDCPGPTNPPSAAAPGPTTDGCVATGRLERLTLSQSEDQVVDSKVLITDWCQQFPSHSVGSLAFDSTGALYVTAGDGASFGYSDYGQKGLPPNPCGDPPAGVGGTQTPPSAEGGALRAQDVRTTGDPTGLDGAVIRVDPATGNALPSNPLYSSSDPNTQRIVAYGFRNPFRVAFRPGTDELWVGDVGWDTVEEINRLPSLGSVAPNFGWPCYEGDDQQSGYLGQGLTLCDSLYTSGTATDPYLSYDHDASVLAGDGCPPGSSAITGLAFQQGSAFPPMYHGALFFTDYARQCIWAMLDTNGDGVPEPDQIVVFRAHDSTVMQPVQLQFGPDGSLYYVNIGRGVIYQISFNGPTAVIDAAPTSGDAPLHVEFSAAGSHDPDDPTSSLSFAWDLDGDGQYDDSNEVSPSYTYAQAGSYTARVRVTDPTGTEAFDSAQINVSNGPPVPTIAAPTSDTLWSVGDTIAFSGGAVDPEDGTLPASSLDWTMILLHCPSVCHQHVLTSRDGVDNGNFVAPDHDYPSSILLELTATDSFGRAATTSVRLEPRTVDLLLSSNPPGATLTLDGTAAEAPFTRTVIDGSSHSVAAPSLFGSLPWLSWSDGDGLAHQITATTSTSTLTASYGVDDPPPDAPVDPVTPPPDPPGPETTHESPVLCGGLMATIVGTDDADTIRGTSGDDVIAPLAGADVVWSGGGDDVVCGGSGSDELRGGGGSDQLRGEAGADQLRGGPGKDTLRGGHGRDRCDGGASDRRKSCKS